MKTAGELLQNKGYDIWSVSPDDTVLDALKLMADKNVGAVLVLAAGNLAGILSERDLARRVAHEGRLPEDTRVWELMTERVICVRTDQTLEECMALITNKRIRHLPVLEKNQLVGVISVGDVVKAIISRQKVLISQLETRVERFEDHFWGTESQPLTQ
jgi:signal-transduction protein with cAMP-binding, CBS, and nucleotidyltransferase domain